MNWKEWGLVLLVALCVAGTGIQVLLDTYPAREDCGSCPAVQRTVFDFGGCFGSVTNANRICPFCERRWYTYKPRTLRQAIDSCLGPFR